MKNNKKGFTLIELLAVIVILAVVALITTPIVLNLINTARKGAFTRSAEMVLKAAKTYHLERQADMELVEDITFTCDNKECKEGNKNLNVQGSMGKGTVLIKASGEILFTLTNNNYCAVKYESSNKINIKKGNCSNIDLTNDTTPPVIKNLTVNTTTNSITIVVSAEDNESGIHHYEYSIDGGQTYEEENTNTKTFKNLEKKDYKIKVKVYNGTYGKDNYSDNTGMSEYEVKDLVQLKDMDFPEIKVTPGEWSTSKTVEIDYKGALVQEYSLDGGTTYIKYEGSFTITENMTIVAKASDGTNNITKSTQVTKIDTEKPTIKVSDISNTYSTKDEVTLTLSDNLSGVTHYCVTSISNSNKCNWIEGTETVKYEINSNGTYYAFSKDKAGNISEGQEFFINKIDTEKPNVKLEVEDVTTNSITVKATCTDNVGISKYEYSKNNGVNYVVGQNETYTFEGLTTGTYNLKVRCFDEAGNSAEASAIGTTNNIDEISLNVSNAGVWSTSKTVTIQYPKDDNINEYIIISGTATKEDGTVLQTNKWYQSSGEKIIFTSNGNISARTSDGINTVTSDSLLISKIDTTKPITTVVYKTADGQVYESDKWTNQSVTAYLSVIDNESGLDHYQMTYEGATWIDIEGNKFTFENSFRTGMWFRAVDKAGNIGDETTTHLISIDKITPTISLDGVPNEITVGDSYELPTSYTVSNELSGGNATCKLNGTTVTNTSSLSAGSKKIDCTVTTGAGKSTIISKTINVKQKTYTVTFDTNGGYIGNPTEIDSGYANGTSLTLAKDANVPVYAGNTISLNTNQNYMLSFDYVADGNVTFDVDLWPDSLPQILPTVTTTMQTMNWIFSSTSSDIASSTVRFFNDVQIPNPYDIRISSIHLYKCDDCTLSSSKTVTYSGTYSTLPSPKRNGYVFQGWYTSATGGTKIEESTPVTVTGNQTLYAQWKEILENRTYTTGDAITFGGYKWHVIGDTGTQVTLLMDAGQLGSNSNMKHCTKDTNASTDCGVDSTGTYYVYSWDKSLIRTYLNGEFLTNLESKIGNEIVSTSICADSSRGDGGTTYGGYLMNELNVLGKTSNCSKQVSDKVRLITYSEYYNMSPHYTSTSSNYPNVGNITKISTTSDYESWLYCNSNKCGNTSGYWWTMSTLDIMTPTKKVLDLIHFKGIINNTVFNLNSKHFNKSDIGFDIYVSVLK